jgi:hypothetical protein
MTLEVDTAAVRAHASEVRALAGDLGGALDAGVSAALGAEAFGIICSFLVPVTSTVQLAGVGALAAAAQSMEGVADGLRETADGYDTVDDLTNGGLTTLIERLPS